MSHSKLLTQNKIDMNTERIDCVFVNASSNSVAFQELANNYSAVETPTWALLLADSARSKGFKVKIIDAEAERLTDSEVSSRLQDLNPSLIVLVVYGGSPNAGTTCMIGASRTAKELAKHFSNIAFVGSHVSALPKEVLAANYVDIVFTNEGVYALHNLLSLIRLKPNEWKDELAMIKGIGYKDKNKNIILNDPEKIVPQDRMDIDLPGYAWDLLPFKKRPLDLYRSHYWHSNFNDQERTPFAAIYTSLGCVYGCGFCMINILNRTDNNDGISSSDSRIMRFWSKQWISKELEKLAGYKVKTLKFSDEMFYYNEKHYIPILEALEKQNHEFNIWCYARVDTVRPKHLARFKNAGINWLCLGIESGNRLVRREVSKGSFKDVKVESVVEEIQRNGLFVLGNYIFGLPEDDMQTMQDTLSMALEMPTEHANFYTCVALPGSPLYVEALAQGKPLPNHDEYEKFAFLSYEHIPLASAYCSQVEILEFRDRAWNKYFTNKRYLNFVEERLGKIAKENVIKMSKIKLKRRIIDESSSENN